jgi:hypothetical protein
MQHRKLHRVTRTSLNFVDSRQILYEWMSVVSDYLLDIFKLFFLIKSEYTKT